MAPDGEPSQVVDGRVSPGVANASEAPQPAGSTEPGGTKAEGIDGAIAARAQGATLQSRRGHPLLGSAGISGSVTTVTGTAVVGLRDRYHGTLLSRKHSNKRRLSHRLFIERSS